MDPNDFATRAAEIRNIYAHNLESEEPEAAAASAEAAPGIPRPRPRPFQ